MPLRLHKDPYAETIGAERAYRDWSRLVSSVRKYNGGLGDRFSFIRVTIPECLPDRLEVISYANGYAFLYDDQMEKLDLKNFQEGRDEMLDVFTTNAFTQKDPRTLSPEKKLQLQIFTEMMAIDRSRAITTMQAWAKFVDLASHTRESSFETLEQYLPRRAIDAGELFWFGMLTFAMALTIPVSEVGTCMHLARPAYEAISLVNDLYSWRKERFDAESAGQECVFNAIWVIMQENHCEEDEAISICKRKITQCVENFESNLVMARSFDLSDDTWTYLEAVGLSHTGNLVWSICCPRYHQV